MQARKSVGTDKEHASVFEISNDCGMKVCFTNIGASITDIIVADRNGSFGNVVLKYADIEGYFDNKNYLGATIGRYANRIADGNICFGEKTYRLSVNEKEAHNHLHGGYEGFGRKVWRIKCNTSNAISFEYISEDGEEGYPGNVTATVEYKLANDNKLQVQYHAITDQATVVNLTNHSYFNLSAGKENILNHTVAIMASEYTPLNERNLPVGHKASTVGSIYDLRREQLVLNVADAIVNTNYCIDSANGLTKAAVLSHSASGRRLTVYATMPGLQLYFGNYLTGNQKPYDGICLEPQYYPDAPNIPAFGYKWLQKEKAYQETIIYHFDTI